MADGPRLYPNPCGTCGAAARRPCSLQRRVINGITVMQECDGSDG